MALQLVPLAGFILTCTPGTPILVTFPLFAFPVADMVVLQIKEDRPIYVTFGSLGASVAPVPAVAVGADPSITGYGDAPLQGANSYELMLEGVEMQILFAVADGAPAVEVTGFFAVARDLAMRRINHGGIPRGGRLA